MSGAISTSRIATLVGEVPSPAFEGLARSLARLIADGRLPLGLRLPSERELATALGLSRTTVTRAYTVLRESGYAIARQGSGTFSIADISVGQRIEVMGVAGSGSSAIAQLSRRVGRPLEGGCHRRHRSW